MVSVSILAINLLIKDITGLNDTRSGLLVYLGALIALISALLITLVPVDASPTYYKSCNEFVAVSDSGQ